MSETTNPTQRTIFRFWGPLAATWLMMAAEGPFVAALIARTPDPEVNLAAFGVAFALALVVEAPVVMLMTASTALVRDRRSYRAVRRFSYLLCATQTLPMILLTVPAVFRLAGNGLLGLPDDVARTSYLAVAALLPWPAAIGYRRFFQGILIRQGLTRRVAYGTVVRLGSMAAAGLVLYFSRLVPGAVVGAGALSAGVVMEAAASRFWVRRSLQELHAGPEGEDLPAGKLVRFYLPLALTTLLAFGTNPLLTFFAAHGRLALESLAVLPVLHSLLFLFRAPGVAFQEVTVALLGDDGEGHAALRRFARSLAFALSGGLILLAFTPLATAWYEHVAGLSPALTRLALPPIRLLVLMPALEVFLALLRALLVNSRRTGEVSTASAVEIAVVTVVLAVAVFAFDAVGVIAAAWALLLGRLAATALLVRSSGAWAHRGGS
jgi:hypothetical protein